MSAASVIELSSLSHPTALKKNAQARGNGRVFYRRSLSLTASHLKYSPIAMSWHLVIRWCWALHGVRATTVEPGPQLLRGCTQASR